MQAVCLPQGKASDYYQQQCKSDNKEMLYFSLEGTLPAGHTLVLNPALGTLSYLSKGIDRPRLEMQQQFTSSELSLLRPLLDLFPHYCPYEVMFASFYNGTITDETVEHYTQRTFPREDQVTPLRHRYLLDFGDGVYPDGYAKAKVGRDCLMN